jgi:hypothetical protein
VVTYGVVTVPDRNDASPADFVAHFQEEDGSIWLASLLLALASVAFLFSVGALQGLLGGSRLGGTVLAGGVGAAVLMLCSMAAALSGAVLVSDRDAPIDPSMATTLLFLGDGFIIAAFYATAAFIGAVGLAVMRTGVLPRWVGWVSLLIAVLMMVPFVGFFVRLAVPALDRRHDAVALVAAGDGRGPGGLARHTFGANPSQTRDGFRASVLRDGCDGDTLGKGRARRARDAQAAGGRAAVRVGRRAARDRAG